MPITWSERLTTGGEMKVPDDGHLTVDYSSDEVQKLLW